MKAVPISELPDGRMEVAATLDGLVKLNTMKYVVGMTPEQADQAAVMFRRAASDARRIQELTKAAPKGLDEQGLIDYLEKNFARTAGE